MTGAAVRTWYGLRAMPSPLPAKAETATTTTAGVEERARRFAAVFDAHHDSIWRTLRRLGVAAAQVDDATQRVFVVAAAKLGAIREGEEGGFLYGIAVRIASETRRRDPARREVSGEVTFAVLADDAPGPEEELIKHQSLEILDEVLAAVPVDLREVLVLVELEGLPLASVAELLDVPLGTATSRLRRAREAFTSSARRVRSRLSGGTRR